MNRSARIATAVLAAAMLAASVPAAAQRGAGPRGGGFGPGGFGPGAASRSARDSAQVDLTGYWVALVTEDWLWRMITPQRGDATSVPLSFQGQRGAGAWNPNDASAGGDECRAFGAAGLMRLPLRLHITWADDNTLKIDTDLGQQTRLLRFGAAPVEAAEPSLQGTTTAQWTQPAPGGFDLRALLSGGGAARGPSAPPKGSVKAVTTNLRAGYLRKNGLPYGEGAELTEYFSRVAAFGNDYLTVLSIVRDPTNLNSDFVTSSHFKREPDDQNWRPAPCRTPAPLAASGG